MMENYHKVTFVPILPAVCWLPFFFLLELSHRSGAVNVAVILNHNSNYKLHYVRYLFLFRFVEEVDGELFCLTG